MRREGEREMREGGGGGGGRGHTGEMGQQVGEVSVAILHHLQVN